MVTATDGIIMAGIMVIIEIPTDTHIIEEEEAPYYLIPI